jgi:hypothetical protein
MRERALKLMRTLGMLGEDEEPSDGCEDYRAICEALRLEKGRTIAFAHGVTKAESNDPEFAEYLAEQLWMTD